MAVVMMFGMVLVSGLYFNYNGVDTSDSLNGSVDNPTSVTSPTTSADQYQNTSDTSNSDDLDTTYDPTQELPDTSTSGNGRRKNRV